MKRLVEPEHKLPEIQSTGCCAFGQLRAWNDTTQEELSDILEYCTDEAKKEWDVTRWGGERTLFCVAHPMERNLIALLEANGFRKVMEMPRRVGYPKVGMLSLYTRTLC